MPFTAISSLMEFGNLWQASEIGLDKKDLKRFLLILSPFAPHIAQELWIANRLTGSRWPKYDEQLIKEEQVTLIIQINGKVRDKMEIKSGLNQQQIEKLVLESAKLQPWLEGKQPKKIIFVPDKLINIVV